MNAVATELLRQVPWGFKLRAYLGAAMSFLDMLSDSYMINEFYRTGRAGTANALMTMVCGNLFIQLLLVSLQTSGLKQNRWRTIFYEVLSVVSFVKAGVDAHRLASGAEQQPGSMFTPLMESSITKTGEVCFEAVPGLVIQSVALMQAKDKSASAVISLLISVGSTAMTSTTLFYDQDVDPGSKKRNPVW